MLEAWKLGKTVWVPKVHGETMDFYEITSFDELKPGAYRSFRTRCRNTCIGRRRTYDHARSCL